MMEFMMLNSSILIMLKILNMKFFNMYFMMFTMINMLILVINNNYFNYYWFNIYDSLGMDYISLSLMMLTAWILMMSLISNNNFLFFKNNFNFMLIMIMMTNITFNCFCSMNMMMFYILFESSLMPIMLIIMGWGYQIDRIQASMYMLFYTLFGSLPLLFMILFMFNSTNTLLMNILWMINNNLMINTPLYFLIVMGFMIKMPIYSIHLWLPKAHVEAPISGSIILAGIMLKMGSYGLYRMMMIFPDIFIKMNNMISFCIMGSLIASLVCLNQTDMKIMIAYSSVVHMTMLMASLLTFYKFGLWGGMLMMIAHGLCSAGMFFLLNCNYERISSRSILINKGMIHLNPSMTMWWFLMYSSNFSAPPSLNLISEIFMFNSMIQFNFYLIAMIMFIIFFNTCYSIFMYAFSQYGKLNYSLMNYKTINMREYLISMLLWMPLNFMFLNLNLLC